jgi:hypothetical protein
MLGLAGVTEIETSVAGVTDNAVEPDRLPEVAVTVVDPWPALLANPLEPVALLIVAAAVFEELHMTAVVSGCVELSV